MERSPLKAPKESDVTPPAVEGSLEFDEDTLKAMERSPLKAPKESDVTPPAVEGSLEFDEDTLKVMGRSPIKAAKESDVTPPAVEGSLEFDDDTFKAIAEVYFQEGNKKYREKEFINAIHFYTEGIEVNCKDSVKNAKMYSNRATAHFQLGNVRESLNDAKAAIKLQPTFIKAIERGARCCLEMRRHGEAMYWCKKGLAIDNSNRTLLDLRAKCAQELVNGETETEILVADKDDIAWVYCRAGYRRVGDNKSAIDHFERSMKLAKVMGDKPTEGFACCELGTVHQEIGNFEEAIHYHKRDLEISEELGDRAGEGRAHCNIGIAQQGLSNYQGAIYHHERHLEIAEKNGDKADEGRAFGNLGNAYLSMGDVKRAIVYLEQSLALHEELGDKLGVGRQCHNLALAFQRLGDLKKVIDYHERNLSIIKEHGKRHEEGRTSFLIGNAHLLLGDFKTAIEYCKHALRISQEVGDLAREGVTCLNLGIGYTKLGSFREAIHYHQLHLKVAKELGDKVREGQAYGYLGVCYDRIGEIKTAIEYHELSLKIAEEVGDRPEEASSYRQLGESYISLGDFEKATGYFKRQLEIANKEGDKGGIRSAYISLGITYRRLGDLEQCKDYFERGLKIETELGNRDEERDNYNIGNICIDLGDFTKGIEYLQLHLKFAQESGNRHQEGSCYEGIGGAYYYLGNLNKAAEYFQLHLDIAKETEDRPGEARAHYHLGVIFEKEDSLPEALKCFQSSVAILNVIRDGLQGNDEWKISLSHVYQAMYNCLWRVLFDQGKIHEALSAAEQGRAQALKDLLVSNYGLERFCVESHLVEETEFYTLGCLPSNTIFIALNGCEIIHWVVQKGKDIKAEVSKVSNRPEQDAITFLEFWIQTAIEKFDVLDIERCEDRSLDTPRNDVQEHETRDETECHSFEVQTNDLRTLYDVIIGPIADLLEGAELIIVPEGPLCLAPFAALVDSDSKYLCESFRIRLIPSLTSFKLITSCPADYHSNTGALLVGDPCVKELIGMTHFSLEQLPWAIKEVEMIGRILKTSPLTGAQATKNEVLKRLPSVALIHIAAHGRMETGEIVLAPNPTRQANQPPKEKDYLLTMADVLQVKLRARLVVLSCCHSARGKIKAEGVVGIARAFLGAGARSVLVSLWAIDDEATQEFMKSFYQHLAEGQSASEALNRTMNFMRESDKFNKVRHWAPFVLIGDDVKLEFGAHD